MKNNLSLLVIALSGVWNLNAQTTLFSENFESGTQPAGWSQQTNATDGGWLFGTATTLSSQYFTIPSHTKIAATNDDGCDCDKSNERLISPVIDLSAISTAILKVDVFYQEGSYQSSVETAKIEISTNGGTTWTSLGTLTGNSDWRTEYFNISQYTGNSNVKIAFYYDDAGGWLFGFAIDNFTIYEPVSLDLAMIAVDMKDFVPMSNNQDVKGTVQNYGGSAITSLDLNYSVNSGSPVTESLTGLNIAPLGSYNYTHGTPWFPTVVGNYSIKVWASNLNGSSDMINTNDTMIKNVTVAYRSCQRLPLMEEFTSSTCSPCAYFNVTAGFDQFLMDNAINSPIGKATAVKYQMNWPDPGNDPSYNSHGNSRRTFYGVSGIPDLLLDGQDVAELDPASDLQPFLDARSYEPAFIELFANHTISNDTVKVTVKTVPYINITSANYKVYMAVVEDFYSYPASTTNQDEYHQVMRKMLPSGSGTALGNANAFNIKSFSQTSKMVTASTPPPAQGSYDLWVGMNNIHVVAWIQNSTTLEVFQSEIGRECTSFSSNVSVTNAACGQSDGAATITPAGGSAPYTYFWNSIINESSQTATGLAIGSYNVLVVDNNRCFTSASVTVKGAISVTPVQVNPSCGAADGSITLTPNSGTAPYTYAWSNGSSASGISGLSVGIIDVTVTDASGCIYEETFTVVNQGAPVLSGTTANATFGNADGSINLTVTGGSSPYTYSWSNSATTEDINSLAAGTYTVTVTDASGCQALSAFTIDEVAGITTVTAGNFSVQIYPNPVSDKLALNVNLTTAGDLSIRVSDIFGRIITEKEAGRMGPGTYTMLLRNLEMQTGTYYVTVTAGNNKQTVPVLVYR